MFAALIRAAERWRGLRFSEFELRQIAVMRQELDAEYEATITPSDRSSQQNRALTPPGRIRQTDLLPARGYRSEATRLLAAIGLAPRPELYRFSLAPTTGRGG
jgi:hypothetical protein